MNILYIGDIMGEPGIDVVSRVLPQLKKDRDIDLVIAQSENVTNGKGLSKNDFLRLRGLGIDFCTGGNWSLHIDDITDYLNDPQQPVIRPANYPEDTPGRGWKYIATKAGPVLVISLLGKIVGKDADKPADNPLKVVDSILAQSADTDRAATIVNFHGDFSSEKKVIGFYLDSQVSAVIGDHWHIPTADAMVLPGGTAHMTDVGMCGSLYSSLGVKTNIIISRWRDGRVSKNELETEGTMQFNAALIVTDPETRLARSIEHIQQIIN